MVGLAYLAVDPSVSSYRQVVDPEPNPVGVPFQVNLPWYEVEDLFRRLQSQEVGQVAPYLEEVLEAYLEGEGLASSFLEAVPSLRLVL